MNLLEESRFIRLEALLTRIAEALEHLSPPAEIVYPEEEAFIDEQGSEKSQQETEDEYLDRISKDDEAI